MQIGQQGLSQNQSPVYGNGFSSQAIRHESYQAKTGDISITTDEGDVVTFSQSSLAAFKMESESFNSPLATGMNFTATSILSENMSFSVEGDLNEQELADIANLYDSLATIADDFFNGEYGKAMVGAMSIGDLGSLSSLNASFTQTQISSTQITTNHVLPANSTGFADALKEMDLPEPQDAVSEQDSLTARWQQISNFLDEQKEMREDQVREEQQQAKQPRRMMDEMASTLEKHPRLSPFAIPLADKAIQEASDRSDINPLQNLNQKQFLKNDFLKQFQDWLEV
jgi:hypothetical protein